MAKIRQKPFDPSRLRLSPEEGFVLSRVDGSVTAKELVALTGLEEARVAAIVARLENEGVIAVDGGDENTGAPAPAPANAMDRALAAFLSDAPPPPSSAPAIEVVTEEPDLESEPDTELEAPAEPLDEEADDEPANAGEHQTALYRKLYESEYHPLERDLRIKTAGEVSGSALFALCLDPEPAVIHAILGNGRTAIDHVRFIALHHRTQMGLEAIAKRVDFLGDRVVQRRLLRNPQLPGTILGRITNPRQLLEVYKLAVDREIPERSRALVRETLRKKFTVASADEKAAFLFKTEGRCLIQLHGCSLDAHAVQILCTRQTYTPLLIQNLGRWSATPPPILAHLLKQPTVKRNPGLRKMLLKHPNTPSEAKRQG